METIRRAQMDDPDIAPVVKWKEADKRPCGLSVSASSPATRPYWLFWDGLILKDRVLFRQFDKCDGTGKYHQLLTPSQMKEKLLKQIHDSQLGGHLGKRKTREQVLQQFY